MRGDMIVVSAVNTEQQPHHFIHVVIQSVVVTARVSLKRRLPREPGGECLRGPSAWHHSRPASCSRRRVQLRCVKTAASFHCTHGLFCLRHSRLRGPLRLLWGAPWDRVRGR